MAAVSFIRTTQSAFEALTGTNGAGYVEGALYFIYDLNIIMHATSSSQADEYGGRTQIVTSYPESGQKQGVLYINTVDNTGKLWTGSTNGWVTVFDATPDATVGSDQTGAVSGSAVHTYLANNSTSAPPSPLSGASGKFLKLNSDGQVATGFIDKVQTAPGTLSDAANKILQLKSTGQIDTGFIDKAQTAPSTLSNAGNKILQLKSNGQIDTGFIDKAQTAPADLSEAANKILQLNGDGQIDAGFLPAIAISEFKGTVHAKTGASDSLEALITDGAENGDWAILDMSSDPNNENGTYIYFDDGDSNNTNTPCWIPMSSATTEAVQALINAKLNKPSGNGTSGQVLMSNGDGTTSWGTTTISWTNL